MEKISIVSLSDLVLNNNWQAIEQIYRFKYALSEEMVIKEIDMVKKKFIENITTLYVRDVSDVKKAIDDFIRNCNLPFHEAIEKYFMDYIYEDQLNREISFKKISYEREYETLKAFPNEFNNQIACYKCNDHTIGICEFRKTDKGYNIDKLYSEIKGEGIGTELLNYVCEYLASLNTKDACLEIQVLTNNERAKALYERLGFDFIKNSSGDPMIIDDTFYMQKDLNVNKSKATKII